MYNRIEEKNAFELMQENINEIREYFIYSKKMVTRYFTLAFILYITGCFLISLSIIIFLFANVSFIYATLPIISGAFIQIIATRVFSLSRKSAEQLNHYHTILHNDERFWALIDLANKVSADKKEDIYYYMIINHLNGKIR